MTGLIDNGRWLASDATMRVNYQDREADEANRAIRVAHLVRGSHTACGRRAGVFAWSDDTDPHSAVRCGPCSEVDGLATHRDMCRAGDITYRQLDFWCRRGLLHPVAETGDQGSGSRRLFDPIELEVVARMGELTRNGVLASVAARLARQSGPRNLDVAWAAERGECA